MRSRIVVLGGLFLVCLLCRQLVAQAAGVWDAAADKMENHTRSGNPLDNTGFDTWGYGFKDNVAPDTATFNWIELWGTTGTVYLNHWPDDSIMHPTGFDFPFYGITRDSFSVASNGFIYFPPDPTYWYNSGNNYTLPCPNIASPAICVFWDWLNVSRNGQTQDQVMYNNFAGYTVIEWHQIGVNAAICGTGGPTNTLTFEAILYPDGKIKTQYLTVSICDQADSSMTVGIQFDGNAGSPALQYCGWPVPSGPLVGIPPVSGRAIWFYPVSWAHNYGTMIISEPAPDAVFFPGSTSPVIATFTNLATTTESSPVRYRFNGGATVTETSQSLVRWGQDYHAFSMPITMPPAAGTYTLTVWSDLPTDQDRTNDTLRTTVRVLVGIDCGDEVVLTGTGRDSATFNNCDMGDNNPGIPCFPGTLHKDMVFKKTVNAGRTFSTWLNSFPYPGLGLIRPGMAMAWGGTCPGDNYVDCDTASNGNYHRSLVWYNSTGTQQTVYVVVGVTLGSTLCGDFELGWQDEVCPALNPPVTQGFEGVTEPSLPDCWLKVNADEQEPEWEVTTANAHSGSDCATLSGISNSIPDNDWMFTPGINMVAGHRYSVTYWRRVQNLNKPDSIEVKAGLAPAPTAMTVTLAATDTCRRTAYVQKSCSLLCAASGVYYIGWHSMILGNPTNARSYIDDITILADSTLPPPTCLPGLTVPPTFLENFPALSLPECWSSEDGNSDSYQWWIGQQAYDGPYCAYMNTAVNSAHDWLFSEPLRLTAGTSYTIEYWRRGVSSANDQTLSLAVGLTQSSAGMTTTLLTPYTFNNTDYVRDEAQFTPTSSGSYYFGILCSTANAGGGTYVDELRVYSTGACGAPSSVTVNSATGQDSATLSCAAQGGWGAADYSFQWYTGADCAPSNIITGATQQTYTAMATGVYTCKAYLVNPSTCGLCDSATATVQQCASNPVTTWPYDESFESVTIPNLPACWRHDDANGDGITWIGAAMGAHFGVKCAYCRFTLPDTNPEDDWLFSKPLHFVASDTMVVRYWYRQHRSDTTGQTESMEVFAGLSPHANAMTYTVEPSFTFDNMTYVEHRLRFRVPVTGNYYIGWHSTSNTDGNGTLLDDVEIYPSTYCTAPTIRVDDVAFPATVTLTAIAYGGIGDPIQYQWYTGGSCSPANIIAGATSEQYTTTVSGTFSCEVWRTNPATCSSCNSAVATVLVPQPGELCSNAIVATRPVPGTPTVLTGSTAGFYPTCQAVCGSGVSSGPDVFYSLTLTGQPQSGCRRIAMALTGGDMLLTVYDGQADCCTSPLLCNDNDLDFTNLPDWDVAVQHPGDQNSYVAAELEPGVYLIRVGFTGISSGDYSLTLYDNGACYVSCDSTRALTVYKHPTLDMLWLNFTAPSTGAYKIYSTTVKNNDGDPRGGDPNWSLDTTIQVTTPGNVRWTDVRPISLYRNYTVIHDCPIIGRCCYGAGPAPLCADNTQTQCQALSGSWNHNLRCATSPCPWIQPAPGEDCNSATLLQGPLPIIASGNTTGHVNDLDMLGWPMPTCWQVDFTGTSNAEGPDVFWHWVVPATGNYKFSTCPATWDATLILFNDTCPMMPVYGDLICGNDDSGPARCPQNFLAAVIDQLPLLQGQHVLIDVDGFAPGSYGSFTLTITAEP